MSDCLFCKISAGDIAADIVYQDDDCVAFRDISPKAPVHLLVIPHKHIENLYDLREEDAALMSRILLTLPKIARQQGLDQGFRTVTNTGTGGGQEVFHLHFHLLGGGSLHPI
ncbi:histidine triad nucleotide-binding protein [Aestuariirhabdus sp. Z084]|uniref:histidine triad nucleotide-binding protein n=1 Tax=Aestuariirhabdus haliotis TaxID=2918751 RepID=UPI00201B3E3A|nr:histidine triad nucleotide-binding protein [Aestuariirhabdus haliotis]MCL6414973.1 histidine triad nucleotide-binding protein [Aestuariirhabdus haliotis]MCL6418905.1 histidine triad nucleotide-binding protein [Aestuariirhabdus haliotis]